jgi:hypothetical protein
MRRLQQQQQQCVFEEIFDSEPVQASAIQH